MDGKQEGGSFLKQMQNKLKNIKRKLEKIESKEKRPASELSEEEKELMRNRPTIEALNQEYERIIANYQSTKEVPVPVEVKPEVKVEVRYVDNTQEVLRLWLALHYVSLPGSKELFLSQGKDPADFEEVLSLRKQALGKAGDSVLDLQSVASALFAKYVQAPTPDVQPVTDALTRVTAWCLEQRVPEPPPVPVLNIDSMHKLEIVHAVEPEPAPVQQVPVVVAQEEEEAPVEQPAAGTWADEEEEEPIAPEESVPVSVTAPQPPEDAEFTVVQPRSKHKKEPAPVESRGRFTRGRRPWGDRRPRTWRGDRGQQ